MGLLPPAARSDPEAGCRLLVRKLHLPAAQAVLPLTIDAVVRILHAAGSRDAAFQYVVAAQWGVISRPQLLALGFTRGSISRWLARGRLHRIFHGIYLVGHPVPSPGAPQLGALLAAGPGSALSHGTAGNWLGLISVAPPLIHVTRSPVHRGERAGICVHRAPLGPGEVRIHDGLPVTSALRIVFDLAGVGHPELEPAVTTAHAKRHITPALITREIEARPGHPGIARLREIAGAESGGFTRSDAERRMRALCRRARLPQPRTNLKLCGWEIDFLWREQRLVVEVDGYGFHGHRASFERDRRKQADLVAAGCRVLRFTRRQLEQDELWVLVTVVRSLGTAQ